MILFILGIVCGLLLALLSVAMLIYMKSPIERTIKVSETKFKPKGVIVEAENEELQAYLDSLPSQ